MNAAVAVTGLGATTPLGGTITDTWEALLAGRTGARLLTEEWAEQLPTRLAAPVAVEPTTVIDRVAARRLDRCQQLALVAAREAWADAGAPEVAPERLAVVVSSGIGGVLTLLNAEETLRTKGPRAVGPLTVPMLLANGPAATVSLEFNAKAGAHCPVSACASGAEAIALALDILRLGRADVVIAGGTEAAVHPLPLAGFAAMRALSTRDDDPATASRPFDKQRDGFVLGEGAGILVLETAEHARKRGAKIHGWLAGAGIAADAHHIAAPDPEGAGAGRAVTLALADAGATPADVIHVNAHATSTPVGDLAEAKALRLALGEYAARVPVSTTKANTGHLLGAAGAVESAFTVLALREHLAPASPTLADVDDEAGLDLVRVTHRALPHDGVALCTSFGFGGHDVALAFRPATAEDNPQ